MKRYLTSKKSFFKANLHNHSTASDGRLTPEEVKIEYMKNGYSIVAFTDHETLKDQSHLSDENFLALKGFEIGCAEYFKGHPKYSERKNCDIGIIAPCEKEVSAEYQGRIFHYEPELLNKIMKTYRDEGCFVIHNHPDWSLERYPDYMKFEYMHATEIYNHSSYVGGYLNPTDYVYDDMLRAGRNVFCVAADDNHNKTGLSDSFGGWCMINAEKLDYNSIMDALFAGNFYSSCGPMIKELYVDDENVLHVSSSPAEQIAFITPIKIRSAVNAYENEPVTEAKMKLNPEMKYVRVVVTDAKGKRAFSNAIHTKDIF